MNGRKGVTAKQAGAKAAKKPGAKKPSAKKPGAKPATARLAATGRGNGTDAPLAGLRILDLSSMIAGPTAAQILADYGADVIKIEPPEGDLMRKGVGVAKSADMGPLYLQLNRNKRSLVLDLKQPAARTALLKLCKTADVFVHNIRRAAMLRLNLTDADVHKANPRIVCVNLVGYGANGPYAGRPAYDDLIQGICAVPALVAQKGRQEPQFVPLTLADRMVGINVAHTILAAVFRRDRSGVGQSVEVPMFETMAHFVLGDHLGGRSFEPPNGEAGNARLTTAARRPFVTRDGHVCALIYTDKQWKAFFEGAGRLDVYTANSHLTDFRARRRNFEQMRDLIDEILRDFTTAEALALLERCDIPCGPMNSLDNLIDDPHLAAVGFFQTQTHPTEGKIRYTGIPSRWDGHGLKITRHAPRLGEHSIAVLEEAGISRAAIDALLRSRATLDGGQSIKAEAAAEAETAS
jgi:crotonobetainyl-CoA:carnitine CoA-transferase CaiB-like acyl-CoA transferase